MFATAIKKLANDLFFINEVKFFNKLFFTISKTIILKNFFI